MTSMGLVPKYYQTPYGEVEIERHLYQTSSGGQTFGMVHFRVATFK